MIICDPGLDSHYFPPNIRFRVKDDSLTKHIHVSHCTLISRRTLINIEYRMQIENTLKLPGYDLIATVVEAAQSFIVNERKTCHQTLSIMSLIYKSI